MSQAGHKPKDRWHNTALEGAALTPCPRGAAAGPHLLLEWTHGLPSLAQGEGSGSPAGCSGLGWCGQVDVTAVVSDASTCEPEGCLYWGGLEEER